MKSLFKRKAGLAVGAALLTTMGNGSFAQSTESVDDSAGLDEIVVTAQKREENLQATPISITALSAAAIDTLGVLNSKNLFGTVPGLQGFEPPSSRGNLSINIRGVPSGNANSVSNDPASALYVDGVYIPKGFGVGLDTTDLERIEVLRGPQGTLYGRNTTGGAVNFVSRKPSGEFRLDLRAGTGNYGLKDYRVSLDLPAFSNISATLAGFKRERDPLYGNTNASLVGAENLDRQGWRVALQFKPSESFSATYNYTHSELSEFSQGLKVVGLNPTAAAVAMAPGYPTNVAINSTSRSATLASIQSNLAFLGPAAATPQVQQLSQWITDYRAWESSMYAAGRSRPSAISGDIPLSSSNDVDAHSLILSWRREGLGALGDVEFKSTTAHRLIDNLNQGDLDGVDGTVRPLGNGRTTGVVHDLVLATIGGLFFNSVSPQVPGAIEFQAGQALVDAINTAGRSGSFNNFAKTRLESFQQELQMVGKSGRLDYATGLFYFTDRGDFRNNRGSLFPIASSDTTSHDNETKAWALYAQGTWRTSDDSPFAITAGLRYTEETKDVTYLWRSSANALNSAFGRLFVPGATVAQAAAAASAAYVSNANAESQTPQANYGLSYSKDFSNVSGKLTLAYDISDRTHSYLTYSTGYKSGTYNGDFFLFSATNAPLGPDLLLPEKINNVEIGIKSDISDRVRLNLGVFRYDYKDMHVSSLFVRPNGSVVSRIQNAGRAKRTGAELELTFKPLDNVLASLSWSTINGDFDEFPNASNAAGTIANTVDFAKRGLAPDNQVAWNVDWQIANTDFAKFALNINGSWQAASNPIALTSDSYAVGPVIFEPLENDQRTLINARLSLSDIKLGSSTLKVSAWGRNLTDDDYREFSFGYGASLGLNVAQYGEPRTYGVDFALLFGDK